MTSWAGFWLGLALVVSTLLVMLRVDVNADRIWPAPPQPAPYIVDDRCPYAPGC